MSEVIIDGVEYNLTPVVKEDGQVRFDDLKIGDIFTYNSFTPNRLIKTQESKMGNSKCNCIFFKDCSSPRGYYGYILPNERVFLIER